MLAVAIECARDAGTILRTAFYDIGAVRYQDGLPVADVRVEDMIYDRIRAQFPLTGIRLEERPEHNRPPDEGSNSVWLIDPHDGTTAAHQGWRGASVSIGVIRDGVPILGVVYAYAYPNDGGDLIAWAEGCGPVTRNGEPIEDRQTGSPEVVLVSKHADRRADIYTEEIAPYRYRGLPGIAYRLAAVAAGDASAGISLHGPRDFDCVGGHALLRGAGLDLFDDTGQRIRYSGSQSQRFKACFGCSADDLPNLLRSNWSRLKKTVSEPTGLIEPNQTLLERSSVRLSRGQGALVGHLIGDALGTAVEDARQRPELASSSLAKIVPPLFISDDGEMTLCLAREILMSGHYRADGVSKAYTDWVKTRPPNAGKTILQATGQMGQNNSAVLMMTNADSESQSNGALMRAVPLALYGVGAAPERSTYLAANDGALTHPHPVCIDINRIYVDLIRQAIETELTSRDLFAYGVDRWKSSDASASVITCFSKAKDGPPTDFNKHSGWVITAFHNALYHLANGHEYEAALSETIASGGDVDTNAAICGGLIGATAGLEAIPSHWRTSILTSRPYVSTEHAPKRPSGCWPVDALHLAEQLLALKAYDE